MLGTNVKLKSKEIRLIIWDIPGTEQYQQLIDLYIKDSFALLLIFDISKTESFSYTKDMLEKIYKSNEKKNVVIIIGNKSDLPDRQISTEEATKIATSNGALYVETSVANGRGIDVVKDIIEKSFNEKVSQNKITNDYKNVCITF